MFIWLGEKAMRKQSKCEHSLETPEQFQTYKYVTLKTWVYLLSGQSQNLMEQWIK